MSERTVTGDTTADLRAIREALEAAYHIAECGDHREHLLDAESKARAGLAALHRIEQAQK